MATFTMYFKDVIEALYGVDYDPDESEQAFEQEYESVTFNGVTYGKLPVLPNYIPVGLGTYPIFNEGYRKILNGKIIDEYYNREIGTETIDNFTLILRKKMDQIMPYYNAMYESTMIDYDALDSMRIHSVGQSHIEGSENATAENDTETKTKSGGRVVGSDFPQTMLAGNADYARTGTDSNSSSEVDSSGSQSNESASNTDSNNENLVTGYQGAASDLIVKYRNSIINVDTMILQEIEDCFMLVLNNGDEYFARNSFYWSN